MAGGQKSNFTYSVVLASILCLWLCFNSTPPPLCCSLSLLSLNGFRFRPRDWDWDWDTNLSLQQNRQRASKQRRQWRIGWLCDRSSSSPSPRRRSRATMGGEWVLSGSPWRLRSTPSEILFFFFFFTFLSSQLLNSSSHPQFLDSSGSYVGFTNFWNGYCNSRVYDLVTPFSGRWNHFLYRLIRVSLSSHVSHELSLFFIYYFFLYFVFNHQS